jgi:hypothetical protein
MSAPPPTGVGWGSAVGCCRDGSVPGRTVHGDRGARSVPTWQCDQDQPEQRRADQRISRAAHQQRKQRHQQRRTSAPARAAPAAGDHQRQRDPRMPGRWSGMRGSGVVRCVESRRDATRGAETRCAGRRRQVEVGGQHQQPGIISTGISLTSTSATSAARCHPRRHPSGPRMQRRQRAQEAEHGIDAHQRPCAVLDGADPPLGDQFVNPASRQSTHLAGFRDRGIERRRRGCVRDTARAVLPGGVHADVSLSSDAYMDRGGRSMAAKVPFTSSRVACRPGKEVGNGGREGPGRGRAAPGLPYICRMTPLGRPRFPDNPLQSLGVPYGIRTRVTAVKGL